MTYSLPSLKLKSYLWRGLSFFPSALQVSFRLLNIALPTNQPNINQSIPIGENSNTILRISQYAI